MNFYKYLIVLGLAVAFCACDLEQEVDIDLPQYESQLVVECYLQAGKPFTLLLSESAPYFESFPPIGDIFLDQLLVDSAEVVISHKGTDYVLENQIFFDLEDLKFFNYFNPELVPDDLDREFELQITTRDGQTVLGRTRLLPVVPIDSVVVEFNEEVDTLARVLTYFTDNAETENFYRRMLSIGSLDSLEQDFTVDDRLFEGTVVFGTNFEYTAGDTIINTIFHITEPYYNFLESVQIAINANFNPFGQPSPIISGLEGNANAIGVFTGFAFDRVVTIIPPE
ncbi:MAG: DUF4249 domain-containing protein [Bacteroidota bacterium]